MILTVTPVTMPTDLAGQTNGKLGPCQLAQGWFHGHGHLSGHHIAMRCVQAMIFQCEMATKVKLTVTSAADAYRSYERQVATFLRRYVDVYDPLRCQSITRTWQGKKWWLLKGMSPSAAPGTSNHGWGLAFDIAVYDATLDDPGPDWDWVKPLYKSAAWPWVVANAHLFGFSWEGQPDTSKAGSEPWHLRYTKGDNVPQVVLDLERWFANA
jgi:hypothetical protein